MTMRSLATAEKDGSVEVVEMASGVAIEAGSLVGESVSVVEVDSGTITAEEKGSMTWESAHNSTKVESSTLWAEDFQSLAQIESPEKEWKNAGDLVRVAVSKETVESAHQGLTRVVAFVVVTKSGLVKAEDSGIVVKGA